MTKPIKPINPTRIKKWDKLFNDEGIQIEILDHRLISGRHEIATFYNDGEKNVFRDYKYDAHDYDGEENPFPPLYKKNPLGG